MALDVFINKRSRITDCAEYNALKESYNEVENAISKLYAEAKDGDLESFTHVVDLFLEINDPDNTIDKRSLQETINSYPSHIVENAKKGAELISEEIRLGKIITKNSPNEEIVNFSKFNFLLPFFDYTENTSDKEISKKRIEELVEVCNKVLADHELAPELLPTQNGFCFGNTQYNNDYFDDVEFARDKFQDILNTIDWENEIVVMHCWW